MPAEEAAPGWTPPPARGTAAGSRLLLQSPPAAFPLGSNDDQQERARAASVRRRSLAASLAPRTSLPNLLNRDQVMDLFHNCIKLASENKINQRNTWEVGLIDHLSEIIQVGEEEDDETNFQKGIQHRRTRGGWKEAAACSGRPELPIPSADLKPLALRDCLGEGHQQPMPPANQPATSRRD